MAAVSPPVPRASCEHPLDLALSGVSERQSWGRTVGCGLGLGTCAIYRHSSEWESFSLWRWRGAVSRYQSKNCDEPLCSADGYCPLLFPCLSVVVTLSWFCFLRMPLLHCRTWGVLVCSSLLPILDSWSASSLPPTLQWEGIHWRVTDVLLRLLLSDVAKDLLSSWWLETARWTGSQSRTLCWSGVSSNSESGLWPARSRLQLCSLFSSLIPSNVAAVGGLDENFTFATFRCFFYWAIWVSSCPGGMWIGGTHSFQDQLLQVFVCVALLGLDAWDVEEWWLGPLLASLHSLGTFPAVGCLLMEEACVFAEAVWWGGLNSVSWVCS